VVIFITKELIQYANQIQNKMSCRKTKYLK